MKMMNRYCGMVDRRKAFSLISSRDHCQRSSPSRISDTPRAGFEPAQNLKFRLCRTKLCSSIFWLIRRRKVGQRQINVETTLCILILEFITSNNVELTLCTSTLIWTTFDNVETTLSFSTSSFITLVNVETTWWKRPFPKRTKANHFKSNTLNSKFYLLFHNLLHFTPHIKRSILKNTCKTSKFSKYHETYCIART